jgi:hypothetical protein
MLTTPETTEQQPHKKCGLPGALGAQRMTLEDRIRDSEAKYGLHELDSEWKNSYRNSLTNLFWYLFISFKAQNKWFSKSMLKKPDTILPII